MITDVSDFRWWGFWSFFFYFFLPSNNYFYDRGLPSLIGEVKMCRSRTFWDDFDDFCSINHCRVRGDAISCLSDGHDLPCFFSETYILHIWPTSIQYVNILSRASLPREPTWDNLSLFDPCSECVLLIVFICERETIFTCYFPHYVDISCSVVSVCIYIKYDGIFIVWSFLIIPSTV